MARMKGNFLLTDRLTRTVSFLNSSFAFFVCLLALTLAYRIQLTVGLYGSPVRPFDFNPASNPVWFIFSYFHHDLALAFACFVLTSLFSQVRFLVNGVKRLRILRIWGLLLLNILLVTVLVVHRSHLRVLFNAQTGLDSFVIKEALSNISFVQIIRFIELRDYLFILLPVGLFWMIRLSPLVFRVWMAGVAMGLVIILSFASALSGAQRGESVPAEIRSNPAFFLLSHIADEVFHKRVEGGQNAAGLDNGHGPGIQPTDPAYVRPIKPVKFLPAKRSHPWNVILFVMESVGTRYMFDTSYGNEMPMSFLYRISKEGWHLKKHYTTSNVSSKADFSILSGLYDFFNRETFSTRSEVRVPTLFSFLGKPYDIFFVTPSSLSWYFPAPLLKNGSQVEIHSYENLNFRIKETYHSLGHYIARDEVQTVDFLNQRINKAREPFLGIYVSFAAHFPYFDYGTDYSVMKDKERSLSRYYNNLSLLDHMIKRVYDNLERQGLLERTIFLIVGDHGQAFGQHHPDNFMHYRYSYNENLETPAIFYQPAIFKPKSWEVPTSHVDLLPTLLDAMRISYNPLFFDGESLFQNQLKRKYVFFYGLEESISSLDSNQIKVQYSLKKDRCWVFDLKSDPEEKNPLPCSLYEPQLEALRRFVNYHDSKLVKYNGWITKGPDFQGQAPPF